MDIGIRAVFSMDFYYFFRLISKRPKAGLAEGLRC
jgi:hypothetical protein